MLLRRVARPLLAVVSVADGVETLINPKPKIEATSPLLAKGQGVVLPSRAPLNPALVVQAGAALKVAAGLLMLLGRFPRLTATLLAIEMIPSTVAENPFSAASPDVRKTRQQHFLSNCGLLGGLLLASTTPGGRRRRRRKAR